MLGIANAHLDSHPLVAITAQAGLHRLYKESHQALDLVELFRPITKWGGMITVDGGRAGDGAQGVQAGADRASRRGVPRSCPRTSPSRRSRACRSAVNVPVDPAPAEAQVRRAAERPGERERSRWSSPGRASLATMRWMRSFRFSERLNLPVATTFLGKGVFPDDHPNALGTIGFMVSDYANFGFDKADVVVAVGYDLVEYAPERWNPGRDKAIIHIHRTVAEVDEAYTLEVGIQGSIGESLDAIAEAASGNAQRDREPPGSAYVREELESRRGRRRFPACGPSGSSTTSGRRWTARTSCSATRAP